MFLYEGEGKQLLARHGIAVPRGRLVRTPEEAMQAQRELDCEVVIKAQVQSGGRGKAGLIRTATESQVSRVAQSLLAASHRGERVRALLVEERLECTAELYVAAYLDTSARQRKLLISSNGGVDVEEDSANVRTIAFHRDDPPAAASLSAAWAQAGVTDTVCDGLADLTTSVVRCFLDTLARQIEINPVGIVDGRAIALDAKVILEDDARPSIERLAGTSDVVEEEARTLGLPMVRLEGDIGVITSGAGLGLATLDTIAACGRKPSNFLDLGGGATPERMKTAIQLVTKLGDVRGLFINVHGGLNDCVLLAEGVLTSGHADKFPMLVRMSGYRADEAQALLQSHGVRTAGAQPMAACIKSLVAAIRP